MLSSNKHQRSLLRITKNAFCQKNRTSNTYKVKEIKINDSFGRPVVLKSLPWNRMFANFDSVPKLINSKGKEVTVKEMVKEDIRTHCPNLVFSQLDPMIYVNHTRGLPIKHVKSYFSPEQLKFLENEEKAKKFEEKIYSVLYPDYPGYSILNIDDPELIYNMSQGIFNKPTEFKEFYDHFLPIIDLVRSDDLTEQEEEKFKEGYSKLKKYIDFVSTRYLSTLNPSPFYDMGEVCQTAVSELTKFSFCGYPEQIHRIILDRVK